MGRANKFSNNTVWMSIHLGLVSLIVLVTVAWSIFVGGGITSLGEGEHGIAYKAVCATAWAVAVFGVGMLLSKRPPYKSMIAATLAFCALMATPLIQADVPGVPQLAAKISEQSQLYIITGSAMMLALPWIFRRLKWPYRTPGHLAAMIGVGAFMVLQVGFHLTVVVPGAQMIKEKRADLIQSLEKGGPDLFRDLRAMGAITSQKIPGKEKDYAERVAPLEAARLPAPKSVLASVDRIAERSPGSFYLWLVDGPNDLDQSILLNVPDKAGGPPQAFIIPPETFLARHLFQVRAYYALTAFSAFGWIMAAMLVGWSHDPGRRTKVSKDKKGRNDDA